MPLFCRDGSAGIFLPYQPLPPLERGAKWRPPDRERDRCQRCGILAMDHWVVRP